VDSDSTSRTVQKNSEISHKTAKINPVENIIPEPTSPNSVSSVTTSTNKSDCPVPQVKLKGSLTTGNIKGKLDKKEGYASINSNSKLNRVQSVANGTTQASPGIPQIRIPEISHALSWGNISPQKQFTPENTLAKQRDREVNSYDGSLSSPSNSVGDIPQEKIPSTLTDTNNIKDQDSPY